MSGILNHCSDWVPDFLFIFVIYKNNNEHQKKSKVNFYVHLTDCFVDLLQN